MTDDGATRAPGSKRSIFKKSTWAAVTEDEDANIFSRRDEVFADVLAERARLRAQTLKEREDELELKRQAKAAKPTPSPQPAERSNPSSQDSKRRKLSHERRAASSDDEYIPPGSSRATPSAAVSSPQPADDVRPETAPEVITLEDSDADDAEPRTIDDRDENASASDEEFPELVARARARAQAKHDAAASPQDALPGTAPADDTAPREPDFAVHILITSNIPESTPLLVRRKLSQRLQDVRQVWCDRQWINDAPLPDSVKRGIFLTWRGNRLFDLTTCRSLGLTLDASGTELINTDGRGFDHGRIHMEAWTEELYKQYRQELERQKLNAGRLDVDSDDDDRPTAGAAAQPHAAGEGGEKKLKIIMRSRDHDEVKILVRPTWPVSRIVAYFRQKLQIAPERDVSVYFDGDKLDLDMSLGDVGLDEDEEDYLEVHIR